MFKDLINNHKIPFVVTAVGLLVAFGLAIAPSMKSSRLATVNSSAIAAQSAALDEALRSSTELGDTLQSRHDALAAQLAALQEQVRVHDLAISRTFKRVVAVRGEAQALTDMVQDADRNGVQISTLNRAVSRLNGKINDLSASLDGAALGDTGRDVDRHNVEISTLNRAVSRLNSKINELSDR